MKILMQIRKDAFKKSGGDFIQLNKTREALIKKGVEVDISSDSDLDLEKYDLVHLFNLSVVEETYKQAINAKKQNKIIVISSIYWNKDEYLLNNPNFKVKLVTNIFGRKMAKFLMGKRKYYSLAWHKQRAVINMSNMVLASSIEEIELIKNNFSLKNINSTIVPLGIDVEIFNKADAKKFQNKYKINDFVLCVGRIEDLKNQIKIIEALSDFTNLVFIGSKNHFFKSYISSFEKLLLKNKNIYYFDYMPQLELADAYKAATICLGASWFETFHLASLEALVVGAKVVATKNSPLKEYFGDKILYCDPSSVNSIKESVKIAQKSEYSNNLQNEIIKNFNWNKVGEKIINVYNRVLNI